MSSADRHSRLVRLFEEACRLSGNERDAFVVDACGDDSELRRDVLALLEHDAREEGLTEDVGSRRLGSSSSELLKRLSEHAPAGSRYRVIGEVDRGGMGVILKVWDDDLRRSLAMKVVLGTTEEPIRADRPPVDERVLSRFLQEAQVTGQLEHPGIVPVHELGIDNRQRVYFTMRLVRGMSFRNVIRAVHDPEDAEWTLTRGVDTLLRACEAMAYAHSKGVIHRDLKPANLMVGKYGETYVMDWGLARVAGEDDAVDVRVAEESPASVPVHADRMTSPGSSQLLTVDGDVLGTPAYMSPEQARGELDLMGPRSDVYSLGAILYELLSGQMPYAVPGAKAEPHEVLRWVRQGAPRALDKLRLSIPGELVAICGRAMEREPIDRYGSVGELARDLRAYLDDRTVQAHRTGPVVELQKWVRRNRLAAAALVLLIAGLSGAGFLEAVREGQRRATADSELASRRVAELVSEGERLWPTGSDAERAAEAWLAEVARLELVRAEHLEAPQRFDARHAEASRRLRESTTGAWEFGIQLLENRVREFRALLVDPMPNPPLTTLDAAIIEEEVRWIEEEARRLRIEPRDARDWHFADRGLEWERARLELAAANVEFVLAPEVGLADRVRARFDVDAGDAQDAWTRCIASVGDPGPPYAGLELGVQQGLVPLGADPRSGLWEFWHVASGERPERDAATGDLRVDEAMGIVLVLLPGGQVTLGSQFDDPDAPHFEPPAGEHFELHASRTPVHRVSLAPYFLSKYELTQAQWYRATGRTPSRYFGGMGFEGDARLTRRHPVESISHTAASEVLAHWRLTLPTEAQWEAAARAGGTDIYGRAGGIKDFPGVNFADQSIARRGLPPTSPLDDGFSVHAPVDHAGVNAWGLHGMLGNVAEWCRDWFSESYSDEHVAEVKPGTCERFPVLATTHPFRGGSYLSSPADLRVAVRLDYLPSKSSHVLGLRPSRDLESNP